MKSYTICKTRQPPPLEADGKHPLWAPAGQLNIDLFHPSSSDHHPLTQVQALHDGLCIYLLFHVRDRFVRYTHTRYMDRVCEDSCVEWFVKPKQDSGYFNFEMNCGGTLHCSYIENHERTDNGFKKWTPLSSEEGSQIKIHTSLAVPPAVESSEPVDWTLTCSIPISLLESYASSLDKVWTGNFYKCADKSSKPHWASWSPIRELNFHNPRRFRANHLGTVVSQFSCTSPTEWRNLG